MPPNLRGILWVAMSGLLFALLNVFTLIPAQHLNSYVMAFLRYFFGSLFLLPIVFRLGLYRSLHNRRLPLHLFRCAVHTAGRMPCVAPFALACRRTPGMTDLLWLVAAGLCGKLGHLCQQRGYQLADITLLQPIGFLSLIWNTLLGFFLFTQKPDFWTFVGAAVIFGSAMYISHREAVRRAEGATGHPPARPRGRRPPPRPPPAAPPRSGA